MPDGVISGGDIAAAVSGTPAPSASPAGDLSPAAAGVSPATATSATTTAAQTESSQVTTQTDPALTATTKAAAEPPQEKWPTILENARTKAVTETETKYAWAKDIPEPHRQTVGQFYQLLDKSPVDAIDLLFQQAAASPEHSQRLRSWIGRTLGGKTARTDAPANTNADAMPEPDFEDQTTGAKFYSAERLAQRDAMLERRITAQLEKKYGPLENDFRTRQQQAADAKVKADADAWADKEYARVTQLPHWAENEKAIAEAMLADTDLSHEGAYIKVVVPRLSMQERSDVVASLNQKTTAASINPANPVTAAQGPPKSFEEGFARLSAGALG